MAAPTPGLLRVVRRFIREYRAQIDAEAAEIRERAKESGGSITYCVPLRSLPLWIPRRFYATYGIAAVEGEVHGYDWSRHTIEIGIHSYPLDQMGSV